MRRRYAGALAAARHRIGEFRMDGHDAAGVLQRRPKGP
jgi:hypothetical protein